MLSIKQRGRPLYRTMSAVCASAFVMLGYDAAVLAGVQETEAFQSAIGYPIRQSTAVMPMIASSYTLGAWVMAMAVSFIGSPLGRRRCILLGNLFCLIGGAIQASSFSVAQIIVGRVLVGFGVGFISSTVPTYMAEMSTTAFEHGPQVCLQLAVTISGLAFAGWVDFGFTRMKNQASWRFPVALQTVFPLISGIGMFLLPDTPRWYYLQGRHDEGDQVLSALHDLPLEDDHVQVQRQQIFEAIEVESSQKPFKLITLLWDNTELQAGRRLRTACLILCLQQLMGVNLLIYYSTIIFSQVGLSPFLSSLLAAVMNTFSCIGTWLTPFTIEKFGRRTIMLWGAVLLSIFMLIFLVMVNIGETDKRSDATQWTAVGAVIAYVFTFGYSWVGVPWLYGPEIAPLRYRHLGGSFSATGEWSMTFVTVFAGGIALQNSGAKSWIWYMVFTIVTTIYVYFCCPETQGKTLEEIDTVFMKHPPHFHSLNLEETGSVMEASGGVAETEKVKTATYETDLCSRTE